MATKDGTDDIENDIQEEIAEKTGEATEEGFVVDDVDQVEISEKSERSEDQEGDLDVEEPDALDEFKTIMLDTSKLALDGGDNPQDLDNSNDSNLKLMKEDSDDWASTDKCYIELLKTAGSQATEKEFYLINKQAVVGRARGDIIINHPSLSTKHCTFEFKDGVLSVTDHGSTNGTSVDGQKIDRAKKVLLQESDVILIGQLEFKIISEQTAKSHMLKEKERVKRVSEEDKGDKKNVRVTQYKRRSGKAQFASLKDKKNKGKGGDTAAGVLPRLVAVLGDVALSFGVFNFLNARDDLRPIYEQNMDMLKGLLTPYIEMLPDLFMSLSIAEFYSPKMLESILSILPYILLYFIIRTVGVLILGVSISQFFMGLTSQGSFIMSRAGGIVRTLIEIVTFPFLIFDLPAVLSKRTVKELVTGTAVLQGMKFISYLGGLIVIPIFIVIGLLFPLLLDPYFQNGGLDVKNIIIGKVLSSDKSDSNVVGVSNTFRFKIELVNKNNDIILFPSFKISRRNNKEFVMPLLYVFFKDKKFTGRFSVLSKVGIDKIIENSRTLDPMFSTNFTNLDAVSKGKEDVNPMLVEGEFTSLLTSSLGLDKDNIVEHVKEMGPFVSSFVSARGNFIKMFQIGELSEISIVKLGDTKFVMHRQNINKKSLILFPISGTNGPIFELAWKGIAKPNDIKYLLKVMFGNAQWNFKKPFDILFPNVLESGRDELYNKFSIFHIIDKFSKKLTKEKRIAIEQYLYDLYFNVAKMAIENQLKDLSIFLTESIEKIILVRDRIDEKFKDLSIVNPDFKQDFLELQTAIIDNNKTFFNYIGDRRADTQLEIPPPPESLPVESLPSSSAGTQ